MTLLHPLDQCISPVGQRRQMQRDGWHQASPPLLATTAPTHGSWLNQAEIEIGMFSRQCPRLA